MNTELLGFYIANTIRNMFIAEGIDKRVPQAELEAELQKAVAEMLAVIEKVKGRYQYGS